MRNSERQGFRDGGGPDRKKFTYFTNLGGGVNLPLKMLLKIGLRGKGPAFFGKKKKI